MTDTRTELLEWLKDDLILLSGSTLTAEKISRFIAYVESAAAIEAENERLRAALDVAWNTIRIWHGPQPPCCPNERSRSDGIH